MAEQPSLTTERLILRPFTADDAPAVEGMVGEREIALNTLMIPHPYPPGAAAEWIAKQPQRYANGEESTFAITRRKEGDLVGAVGLIIRTEHDKGEFGYWIGKQFWGRGYATEATAAVIRYGFEELSLNRIFAVHFSRNPSSGRVMLKNGMRHEGTLRQDLKKWGEYVDMEAYGILRSEWAGGTKLKIEN